jgi:hypothetical protein
MIKNMKLWQQWEEDYIKSQPADFSRNLALLEAMYEEARALKQFPLPDALEGLNEKIRIIKSLHVSETP